MTTAAAIFLAFAGSLADGIACAVALYRRNRDAWPPRRVIASMATIEETFG